MATDLTNGQSFFKWYTTSGKLTFSIFFHIAIIFGLYISIFKGDEFYENIWRYIITAFLLFICFIYWLLTIRNYKLLKKGISR